MNWKELWMTFFGTTEWLGLNIGFWMAMAVVLLLSLIHIYYNWRIGNSSEKQKGSAERFRNQPDSKRV